MGFTIKSSLSIIVLLCFFCQQISWAGGDLLRAMAWGEREVQSARVAEEGINIIEIELPVAQGAGKFTMRQLIQKNEPAIRAMGVEEPFSPVTYRSDWSAGWISDLSATLDQIFSDESLTIGYEKILKPTGSIKTILVVEDEARHQTTYKKMFERSAFPGKEVRIIYVSDGKEALRILTEEKIDLLITDLQMPEVEGEQIIRQLRNEGNLLPIIVISGMSLFNKYDNVRTFDKHNAGFERCFDLVIKTIHRSAKPPQNVSTPVEGTPQQPQAATTAALASI